MRRFALGPDGLTAVVKNAKRSAPHTTDDRVGSELARTIALKFVLIIATAGRREIEAIYADAMMRRQTTVIAGVGRHHAIVLPAALSAIVGIGGP